MKQFSLEEFKKNPNRKVVTRDGRPVRIICTDAKGKYPVIGLALNKEEVEVPENYTENGCYLTNDRCDDDIFFAPEKKEGWINLRRIENGVDTILTSKFMYSKEEAEKYAAMYPEDFLATAKVTWEE